MKFKIIKTILFASCFLAFVGAGCTHIHSDPFLEEALAMAGSNRVQLEAVLKHYAKDSIALESAKFLIRNMPGHYSYQDTLAVDRFYECLDSLVISMRDNQLKDIRDSIVELCKRHEIDQFKTIQDVKIIRADFLIDNNYVYMFL